MGKSAKPVNSGKKRDPSGAVPPVFPGFASPGARRGFLILSAALLVLAFAMPSMTRGLVMWRQSRLPENQIWNAVRALDSGDVEQGREIANAVISTTIDDELEGNALYYLAPYYHELAAKLAANGLYEEARAMEYKSLRHYHRVRRHLEYMPPWIELEKQYAKNEFGKFLSIFEIIGSHSLASTREVGSLFSRDEWANLTDYAIAREAYYNRKAEDVNFASLARRKSIRDPAFWISAGTMEVRNLLRRGQKDAAIAKARELVRAFPGRLETGALAAEANQNVGALRFADNLKAYSSWTILDFKNLKPAATEYHEPRPIDIRPNGAAWIRQIGAGELSIETKRPAKNVYLIAAGTQFLGIFPIVLVTIDGGEPIPMYIDHVLPTVYSLDVALEPGRHQIRFEFLNDARVDLRGTIHDRDVGLMRLVLVPDGER